MLPEKETDLDDNDDNDELDIEIVDDVPPEERPRTAEASADEDVDNDDTDDDDLEGYSEKVQKRLKKLTFKYREAERKEQDAGRLRDEAVRYAQQVADENAKLRTNVEQGQGAYVEQAKARAAAELDKAKRAFREAYEAGDSEGLTEAQGQLSKAQMDLSRFENYRPRPVQSQVPQRDWQQPQQQPQQQPALTEQQQRWMQENTWFGKNKAMTGFAYGVHETLVESGVDPNSKTYYARVDKAMRERFADEFEGDDDDVEVDVAPKKRPANVVAPAQRSAKQPRKVKLTSTQAALARRLGVPPEVYAAQMLKDAKNG